MRLPIVSNEVMDTLINKMLPEERAMLSVLTSLDIKATNPVLGDCISGGLLAFDTVCEVNGLSDELKNQFAVLYTQSVLGMLAVLDRQATLDLENAEVA